MHNSTRPKIANGPDGGPSALLTTLAHHDAEIVNLSARMTGVENSVKTLGDQVSVGFSALTSKLDRLDSAPKIDMHKTIGSVVALAVLFSMVVGGIIYITNSQSAAVIAEQKSFNGSIGRLVEKHEAEIDQLQSWSATVVAGRPK